MGHRDYNKRTHHESVPKSTKESNRPRERDMHRSTARWTGLPAVVLSPSSIFRTSGPSDLCCTVRTISLAQRARLHAISTHTKKSGPVRPVSLKPRTRENFACAQTRLVRCTVYTRRLEGIAIACERNTLQKKKLLSCAQCSLQLDEDHQSVCLHHVVEELEKAGEQYHLHPVAGSTVW